MLEDVLRALRFFAAPGRSFYASVVIREVDGAFVVDLDDPVVETSDGGRIDTSLINFESMRSWKGDNADDDA